MKNYKLSIIVPSYNQGKYLEENILSIINQDYKNYELIIIDGGSTDKTIDVIHKYEKYIAYWVSESDNGQANALNKGYKIASGDIVGWQNSDDLYEEGAFKNINAQFDCYQDIDFIYGNYRLIDKNSKIIKNYVAVDFDIYIKLYENSIVYNQAMFWMKSFSDRLVIKEYGGPFDEQLEFVMDADFTFRAYLAGSKFKRVNKFIGSFRMHPENKTTLMENVFVKEYNAIRRKLFNHFSKGKETILRYPLKVKRLFLSNFYKYTGK